MYIIVNRMHAFGVIFPIHYTKEPFPQTTGLNAWK